MTQESNLIKIALVDDHILIRDALGTVINAFENCSVTLVAMNGNELIEKMSSNNPPQIVILDLNMPEMDGYETAKWLKENHPEILVLVLTMYDSELALIRVLQHGVRGFMRKDIHPSELKFAIESTISNGYYYSNNSTGKLMNHFRNEDAKNGKHVPVLSENELAFLKLSSTDMTYKEIARQMSISPRTVDNYRDALFIKLDVKSRVGLVMYAIKNGIIKPGY